MLDLSAQSIIYEVSTIIYMVRLLRGAFANPSTPSSPTVFLGVCRRGVSCHPKGYLCLLRDPPGLPMPIRSRSCQTHTWVAHRYFIRGNTELT